MSSSSCHNQPYTLWRVFWHI